MKPVILAAAFAAALSISASAQTEKSPVPEIPEPESPFFVRTQPASQGPSTSNAIASASRSYPQNKSAETSAAKMFTGFFSDMFASVHLGSDESRPGSKLDVEPRQFSVDERREVTVTYTIFNKSGKLLMLNFPTSQRIEILVRDPQGKVIERWSDDRMFDDISGVVMINPNERIQYQERIATREMQPGKKYTIEASLANNTEFTKVTEVTPTGKAPEPLPQPQLTPAPAGEAAGSSPTPAPAQEG